MLILNYHQISSDSANTVSEPARFYALSRDRFVEQINWLASQPIKTLTIDEFLAPEYISSSGKDLIITFDDGYLSDIEIAAPLLFSLGLRATFFICIEFIGRPGYMSWKQIAELLHMRMSVQCHGLLHHDLSKLPVDAITDELSAAKLCLERNLGVDISFLSLPGGFSDSRVYSAAFRSGYKAVCNSSPGIAKRRPILNRIALRHSSSLAEFQSLIRGDYKTIAMARLKYGTAKQVKRLVGVERYEELKVRLCGANRSSELSIPRAEQQQPRTRTNAGGSV